MQHETAELLEMLTYRRPTGGTSEREFIARYLDSIPGMKEDSYGNRYISIGDEPGSMFSSHTDSVHGNDGKQRIAYDPYSGLVGLAEQEIRDKGSRLLSTGGRTFTGSNCLGADDATGVFIMRRMIRYAVPGLYVFHRNEENGGIGSAHLADKHPELVDGIKQCVAFDRKGTQSIITHQYGRCCSTEWASAFAGMAADCGLEMELDDTGLFTDSANYTHLIPECTNLSVGYYAQHTTQEVQDIPFALAMADAACSIPWGDLPIVRDVNADLGGLYCEDPLSYEELEEICYKDYQLAARLLEGWGVTRADIYDMEELAPQPQPRLN